jgi:hypothetical protein
MIDDDSPAAAAAAAAANAEGAACVEEASCLPGPCVSQLPEHHPERLLLPRLSWLLPVQEQLVERHLVPVVERDVEQWRLAALVPTAVQLEQKQPHEPWQLVRGDIHVGRHVA